MTDPIALTEALIACPSVTPATGTVFDCLEAALRPLGFDVHRAISGEEPDGPVENLFAIRQGPAGSRHVAFAGHVDVVPPGDGPIVALGGAGDARIISAVIQVISRMIDHGLPLARAVAAPRVHPDSMTALRVEEGPVASWTAADRARLEAWGFTLTGAPSGFFGRVHAVSRSRTGGARDAATATGEGRRAERHTSPQRRCHSLAAARRL